MPIPGWTTGHRRPDPARARSSRAHRGTPGAERVRARMSSAAVESDAARSRACRPARECGEQPHRSGDRRRAREPAARPHRSRCAHLDFKKSTSFRGAGPPPDVAAVREAAVVVELDRRHIEPFQGAEALDRRSIVDHDCAHAGQLGEWRDAGLETVSAVVGDDDDVDRTQRAWAQASAGGARLRPAFGQEPSERRSCRSLQ